MSSYHAIRHEAYEANMALAGSGLVIGTFGNASAADRDNGLFAIKPSGVPYESLAPDMMVVVDFSGRVVAGRLRPSSDTPTHAVLYRAFTSIGGVVHTHSVHATAWAQAMLPIPCYGTTHADHLACPVPCTAPMTDAQIAGDYEVETGRRIIEVFRDLSSEDVAMVLVAGHGPFTWGATAGDAVQNSIILEKIAQMAALTVALRPDVPSLKQSLIDRHFYRKHGHDAYYGN